MTTLLAPPVIDTVLIDSATRREFLGLLTATGLLTACGADRGPDVVTEGETRTFVDSLGRSVQVPADPRRIVATQAVAGEALLALGAPLVGLETEGAGFYPPLERDYDMSGVTGIGGYSTIDVERIVALQPDLIIGYSFGGEWVQDVSLDALEAIAPTVALGEDTPRAEYQQMVASLTGRDDVLAAQRAEYEQKLDDVRTSLGEDRIAALSVITLGTFDGEIYVFTRVNPNPYVSILQDLGVALTPAADSADLYTYFSFERLGDPALQADVVLYPEDGGDPTSLALWPLLPAVTAGQAHRVPVAALTSYRTSIRVLDTLLPLLRAADPATA